MDGLVIPERYFSGLGVRPEWGIKYDSGKMLLFEFGTADNLYFTKTKVTNYGKHLPSIEERFGAEALVVFVLDVGKKGLRRYLETFAPTGPQFYFVDCRTFLGVPIAEAVDAQLLVSDDADAFKVVADELGLESPGVR